MGNLNGLKLVISPSQDSNSIYKYCFEHKTKQIMNQANLRHSPQRPKELLKLQIPAPQTRPSRPFILPTAHCSPLSNHHLSHPLILSPSPHYPYAQTQATVRTTERQRHTGNACIRPKIKPRRQRCRRPSCQQTLRPLPRRRTRGWKTHRPIRPLHRAPL